MRRKDRECPAEFALELADACSYATLSTVDEVNKPYAVPINIVRDGMTIYFHSAKNSRKTANLRNNPEVCLTFVGRTNVPEKAFTMLYESAVIFGTASLVEDEQTKTEALRRICLRFTPGNMEEFDAAISRSLSHTAVWKIDISEATGKSCY